MSTRDMIMEVTNAYKVMVSNYIGHALPLMAQLTGSYNAVYGSILPLCGPLLFINQNKQRWTTGCAVSYTYKKAILSGYESKRFNDLAYYKKSFTGLETIYSGSFYIETGTREYSQFCENTDYVYEVLSITGSDPFQEINIYCLADDGSRLIHALETENTRNLEDIAERGLFLHPPTCLVCGGEGIYSGITCPECSGYRYVGRNAEKYLLTQRAKDVGILKQTESEESFQYRAWAKKWHIVPTKSEVKRYIAHMLRTATGNIEIEEHYMPEAYWIVRFPAVVKEEVGIGDLLSISGNTLQNIVSYCEPAGTRAILQEYYFITSDGNIWDYDHNPTGTDTSCGISDPPHISPAEDLFGWFFFDMDGGFNNRNFGSDWETSFFYEDKYILSGTVYNTGIIYLAGTGCWSGNILMAGVLNDTNYWSGTNYNVSGIEYEFIMLHDCPFTTSGTWLVS